ncbi:sodium-coupled monocarboxylate transporter 2-like isoform X2 [Haliotis asinina]
MESHTFGKWDYTVFGVMVAVSVSIGIYHAIVGRHGKLDEYLLAGRSMTFFPVALSLIATFTSTITMLGVSAEAYSHGIMWILSEIAFSTGQLLEMFLLLTVLKRLNISSPFQYLEGRFQSKALRLIATSASCVQTFFYMCIVLAGQGLALGAVTGISTTWSVLVTSVAAVLYTAVGGLRAVIWTDVIQYILMIIGVLTVAVKGTLDVGGLHTVHDSVANSGRLTFIFDIDPTIRHTVWNVGLARVFAGMGWLVQPAFIQRIASTKSLKHARWAMLLWLTCSLVFGSLTIFSGLVAFSYYDYKRCDPIASNQIDSPDQILPFMIIDIFRNLPGMPGLFLAAIFSASLSSLSSGLSALSNITWEDFVKPQCPSMSEFKQMAVVKLAVVAWGVLICCLATYVASIKSITILQIYFSASSIISGPTSSLFYLGVLFPFVNTRSAIAALLVGLSFLTWLVVGASVSPGVRQSPPLPSAPTDHCLNVNLTLPQPMTILNSTNHTQEIFTGSGLDNFYSLSYTLYQCFGFLIVQVLGVTVSLATGGNKANINPLYVRQYFWRQKPANEHVMRSLSTPDTDMEDPTGLLDEQQAESSITS